MLSSETHVGPDGASHSRRGHCGFSCCQDEGCLSPLIPPTFIMNAIGKHGVHPTLLGTNFQPRGNAFSAPRRAVPGDRIDAGAPRGGTRGDHVPRLMDGSAAVQNLLRAEI